MKHNITTILLSALIGIVLAFGAWFIGGAGQLSFDRSSGTEYQAVFLNTDQVYFGKLAKENSQFPVLTDVYYLQFNESLQELSARDASQIRLIKLGGELHGPTDEMRINRDHIVIIEDLRSDSGVVKAIRQYQSN